MSKQREALKLALKALEEIAAHYPADWESDTCVDAKRFLREALAEPARKPLTDEEILNLWEDRRYHCEGEDFIKLVRWIERWYRQ